MTSYQKKAANEFGLYLGGLSILVSVVGYVLDLDYKIQQNLGYLGLLFATVFIILVIRKVKNEDGGFVSFGGAFKTALRMSVIAGLFSAVWLLLYTTVVHPEYQDEIIEYSLIEMEEQDIPEESKEMAVEWTRKFTSPGLFVTWGFLGSVLPSLIIALIVAAIMQKPKPVFEDTVD